MNKWLVFLLGIISGIAITFIAAFILTYSTNIKENGMTFFENPGECLSTGSFEIFQVIDKNKALAYEIDHAGFSSSYTSHTDLLVLLINEDGTYYYDDQVIDIPDGKCARQVGIYKYPTKDERYKTVPIVKLMDK